MKKVMRTFGQSESMLYGSKTVKYIQFPSPHFAVGALYRWLETNTGGSSMSKKKRKLTSAEKAVKKRRRMEYMTIFVNGKQKRVKRPPTIDGLDEDEFIARNADPIWLHQNGMWEYVMDDGEVHETDDEEMDIPF